MPRPSVGREVAQQSRQPQSYASAGGYKPAGTWRKVGVSAKTSSASQPESLPSKGGTLSVGSHIEHERFGRGRVLSLEGSGESAKACVEFENAGTKQLLLKFARFRVL